MYQSFTGTSRRPRQVNLSGKSTNPFAKTTGAASGAQAAVASAQQERINRQLQRERIQASSRIQKVWRGHRARRRTYDQWRQIWDAIEKQASTAYASSDESLQQLRRLLLFFSPKSEPGDVERLCWYGTRQIHTCDTVSCCGGPWPTAYGKLQRACIAALKARSKPEVKFDRELLGILAFAAARTIFTEKSANEYYKVLTSTSGLPKEQLEGAFIAPLTTSDPGKSYTGLVVLLARPLDPTMLQLLRPAIDPALLSEAVAGLARDSGLDTRGRLWLLGNMVFLVGKTRNMTFTAAVARLLGSLADDVDFEGQTLDLDNSTFDREVLAKIQSGSPLNTFLQRQIELLLDEDSIRNLLVGVETVGDRGTAQALAGYALTLLRCFPRKADQIRMWLHLGPMGTETASPTRHLWDATAQSSLFARVVSSSRDLVSLLKDTHPSQQTKDEWMVVLVFMEMFSFDMRLMDDEEFLGNSPVSKRNSAVQVSHVGSLVTFLKHLAYTLYFEAASLNESGPAPARDEGLFRYPGRRFGPNGDDRQEIESKPLTIAGIPGLTTDYLKGIVTGLLRAIYERDSRRGFLHKDQWLMTDRFDMGQSFIEGVVEEEEKRQMVQDDDDKEDESDDEADDTTSRLGLSNHARVLRSQAARDRAEHKASVRRFLEKVAPRLEVLQKLPFFIPFETRVKIFRQFVYLDQLKRRDGQVDPDMWRQNMMFRPQANGMHPNALLERHHAKIKRTQEFQDAYEQFYGLGAALKEPIQITFVDQWDMPEAGIDGGGVTKEFLTSVINQAFDQEADHLEKFFVENEQHLLYPNPTSFEDLKIKYQQMGFSSTTPESKAAQTELYKQYQFLGRVIGKCLYEGILVDVSFAGFFLKQWALTGGSQSARSESHYKADLNDLRELDEGLYRGLLQLKNAENAEELGMTFSVNEAVGPEGKKQIREVDLMVNGSDTPITNQNRLIYIQQIARYKLQAQAAKQIRAFISGLSDIIQPSWLSMFNQMELQTLIGGSGAGIDVQDLRRNTLYGGTYVIGDDGREHPSIELFWNVMKNMKDVDRRKVLKFVTSTPRGPLLGFDHLNPRFSIRDSGSDENRYPTTSTCVNLLKLPMYKSEKTLREKLLAAVNSGAGFDLS